MRVCSDQGIACAGCKAFCTRDSQLAALELSCANFSSPCPVWPLVQHYTPAQPAAAVSITASTFRFCFVGANGTSTNSPPAILAAAFARYRTILFGPDAPPAPDCSARPATSTDTAALLTRLDVTVDTTDAALSIQTNESYRLSVAALPAPSAALRAVTVFGALRGLETFAQLGAAAAPPPTLTGAAAAASASLAVAACSITDFPQYRHRGFMVLLACSVELNRIHGLLDMLTVLAAGRHGEALLARTFDALAA